MKKLKFTFKNAEGEELAGLLELPENPKAFALLAHCFTCGKDLKGAARIARKLTENSIAVLRFDFTGLGNSEGDFSNTNFSSNISDLLCAVDYLRREYEAPSLLIGHSLGGSAILSIAAKVPEARAVVTIGSPGELTHVQRSRSYARSSWRTTPRSATSSAPRPANGAQDSRGVHALRPHRGQAGERLGRTGGESSQDVCRVASSAGGAAVIEASHQRAASAVNAELTLLFWRIGKRIHTEALAGQRAG